MKTIALFDANCHGHHPTYLCIVSKLLLENNYNVWLFCQESQDIKKWLRHNLSENDLIDNIVTFPILAMHRRNILTWWFWSTWNWRYASVCLKKAQNVLAGKPDVVFFLKIDDFTKGFMGHRLIEYLFPYTWAGLYIHFDFPKRYFQFLLNAVCRPFSIFNARQCVAIGTLQEDMVEKIYHQIKKPVFLFPDIVDSTHSSGTKLTNDILKKANGRRIIGLIGSQDRRKGSFDLLKIAERSKDRDWFFLFAGKTNYLRSDHELEQLERIIAKETNWDNCYFYFKRIPQESDFNALVNLCDVIYAVYRKFPYSSNIMTKAALYQKPIVVATGTLMEQRVKRYRTGISCKEGDIDAAIRTISDIFENKLENPQYDEYVRRHSTAIFVKQIDTIIQMVNK